MFFWWKKQYSDNNFHVDCDQYDWHINNIHHFPILSCITYINTNNYPTLITNIKPKKINENYIEQLPQKNKLILSFPIKYKHIAFDGSNYHGMVNIENDDKFNDNGRKILCINLLNKIPLSVPFYDKKMHNNYLLHDYRLDWSTKNYNKNQKIFDLKKNTINTIQNISNNILNIDFYNKLLFEKNITSRQVLKDLLDNIKINSDTIIINEHVEKNNNIIKGFISPEMCFWIKTICKTDIINLNTTPNIYALLVNLKYIIFKHIEKIYNDFTLMEIIHLYYINLSSQLHISNDDIRNDLEYITSNIINPLPEHSLHDEVYSYKFEIILNKTDKHNDGDLIIYDCDDKTHFNGNKIIGYIYQTNNVK